MNHPMFAWGTFISGRPQKNSHPRNLALNRFAHVWRQHPPGLRHLRRSRRPRGNPWFPGSAGGQEGLNGWWLVSGTAGVSGCLFIKHGRALKFTMVKKKPLIQRGKNSTATNISEIAINSIVGTQHIS